MKSIHTIEHSSFIYLFIFDEGILVAFDLTILILWAHAQCYNTHALGKPWGC